MGGKGLRKEFGAGDILVGIEGVGNRKGVWTEGEG